MGEYGGLIPFLILVIVAVAAVVVWIIVRFIGPSALGRRAEGFFEAEEPELPPEQRINYNRRHPGSGGTV